MRSFLIALALLCMTSPVWAKPKVAIAPLRGDAKDRVDEALREALAEEYTIVSKKEVARALGKLGLSGPLDERDCKKLQGKLGAAVVIQAKLGKAGKKKSIKFSVAVRGKSGSDFTLTYKSAASAGFRDAVREALAKRIGSIDDGEAVTATDEEAKPKKKKSEEEEEKPKKRVAEADEEEAKPRKRLTADDGEEKPRKRKASEEEEEEKPKKRLAAADDGEEKPRKRKASDEESASEDEAKPRAKSKKRVAAVGEDELQTERRARDDDGERASGARPLPVARIDAGLSVALRKLSYAVKADSASVPPKVGTGAGGARIEGELYPVALSDRKSPLARLGLVADYDKTVGLSVPVPNAGKSVTINQSHFSIGARYRLPIHASAIAFDLRYARRQFVADRTGLAAPTDFDAPDVTYSAVMPGASARVPVAGRISLYGELAAMLVLSTGDIQETKNYGAASVFGLEGAAGVDVALAKQFALRIGAEYTQLSMSFKGSGDMAKARGVTAATDRFMGVAATVAAMF